MPGVDALLGLFWIGGPEGREGLLHDFFGADGRRTQMSGVDLTTPVGKAAGLVSSPGTEGESLVHCNVALVTIGEGEGHGSFEGGVLVDPEFVLAEHLVGHGSETPFPAKHHSMSIKTAARWFLHLLKELLDLAELFHPARILLLKIHHFRKKLPAGKRGGREGDGGGLDGEPRGLDPFTGLDSLEGGFSKAMSRFLGFLMSGTQGKAVDIAAATLAKDGDDLLAEDFPDSFSGGPGEVRTGELAGVRNNYRVGGMFKENGEGFTGPGAVSDKDVDPRNGRTLAVDPHEDVSVVGIYEAPVEADLDARPASPKGDWFRLFPGLRHNCDDGIKGLVVPAGAFIVGHRGPAAGSEGG